MYFGTGDATTAPAPKTTDGVMAVDLNTGKLLWSYQATENDVFMGGCNGAQKSEACPEKLGPDMDIGNSPILVTAPNGKRVLLGGTKAADVFALDPDRGGALLYRVNPSGATPGANPRRGGASIVWGGAADATHVYYGMGSGGLAALDAATGATVWKFTPQAPAGNGVSPLGAAPTTIPGVVFTGSTNGMLYAVSAADGKELWSFDTSTGVRRREQGADARRRDRVVGRRRRRRHAIRRLGLRGRAAARAAATRCSRSGFASRHRAATRARHKIRERLPLEEPR